MARHVIQRGNNRQICFATANDCRFYLDWLGEYAEKVGWQIHAQGAPSSVLAPQADYLPLGADADPRRRAQSSIAGRMKPGDNLLDSQRL